MGLHIVQHNQLLESNGGGVMYKTKESYNQTDWNDWKFQLRNNIKTTADAKKWINLSQNEIMGIETSYKKYLWTVTPYYMSLMNKEDENCPIRLQAIPNVNELSNINDSQIDPVGDMDNLKTNRVIHKYPNRVVLLVSDTCSVLCRHCTRKYHTLNKEGTYFRKNNQLSYEDDFSYIENHQEINDVLLTGGDPLIKSDEALELIIKKLRSIPHVNIIRIGSRCPVTLPQRITHNLCKMLEKYHPIWLNTHFNHPNEITEDAAFACDRLLRYGIPVQNQSVLLKGINDNVDTMRSLIRGLLGIRVRPYYLYHCDRVNGVSHFSTSLVEGMNIMDGLSGFETGFSVPSYVIATKLGKIPIQKTYIKNENDRVIITNYKNQTLDITEYLSSE